MLDIRHLSDVPSREIDKILCQIYTKTHIYIEICTKIVVLNRSYLANTQPIWKQLYHTAT